MQRSTMVRRARCALLSMCALAFGACAMATDASELDEANDLDMRAGGGGVVVTASALARSTHAVERRLGPELRFWFRAEDFVPVGEGAPTAYWLDATGQRELATFTADTSPTVGRWPNGRPTVLTDGHNDCMGTGGVLFPAGERPHLVIVFRAESTALRNPSSAFMGEMLTTYQSSRAGMTPFQLGVYAFDPVRWQYGLPGSSGMVPTLIGTFNLAVASEDPADVFASYPGPAYDALPHVVEMALVDDVDGHFVVDGVPYDRVSGRGVPNPSPLLKDLSGLTFGSKTVDVPSAIKRPVNVHYLEIIGFARPLSRVERTLLRAYLRLSTGVRFAHH